MEKLTRIINLIAYSYKRNCWILDSSRFFYKFDDIKIDKPIFLLGTHGGGLTLVSRMLRRNKNVVSVTGNYKYWSGADEMHVVLGPILPFEFTGVKHHVPYHPNYKKHRSWLYATNGQIQIYRKTKNDVTPELSRMFKKTIRWCLARNAINKDKARFTDKSQSFTVKVDFINEILKDSDPKFILISRNPYTTCFRAPKKAKGLLKIRKKFSYNELLELASQHWANSMKYALEDSKKVKNFFIIKFEDIIKNPKEILNKICHFAEIEFNNEMLPQKHHKMPLGSRYFDRWYPLQPNINTKYYKEIKKEHIDIINKYCKEYAEFFGYTIPSKKN